MPKVKSQKKHNDFKKKKETFLQKLQKEFSSPAILYFLGSIFTVFLVYFFSLFREWQAFDERDFYNETIFPIPTKFDEIIEVIRSFVLGYHIESMNTFFSNHITIRSNPIAASLVVFVSYFLKKNALLYHILQLAIHLINTALAWLIFYKITNLFEGKINNNNFKYLITSLFTLAWALHSANTEAILLVTNWGALLTYTFCFLFLYFEISTIITGKKVTKLRITIISILFCLAMFLTEYGYSMPLILFCVIFAFTYKNLGSFTKALSIAALQSSPYFIGLLLFGTLSLLRPDSPLVNLFNISSKGIHPSSLYMFIERNLWLVPQIFLHFLKLLFFPKTLSTYQSNLIHLSSTLFEPYSIICTLFYLLFLLTPIIIFLTLKNKGSVFSCSLIYAFYFSLFPFLHVLLPTYCLTADRYCYFPSFILLFLLLNFLLLFLNLNQLSQNKVKPIITTLACLVFILGIRTLIRIQEWNNSDSLYKSSLKIEKNPLYNGQRLIVYADYIGAKGKKDEMEESLQESLRKLHKALKQLTVLKRKYPVQPITLKLYGLDYDSLILKAAYGIATIKNDNYQENPKNILAFYEPYIKKKLHLGNINQLTLYADILLKDGQHEKSKTILESGLKRFPYSSALLYSLANFYLELEKDLDKANKILQQAYYYFPNQTETLYKLFKYYEKVNDLQNQAKFAYLLGLRDHSAKSYQRAVQIYLDLNQLNLAEKSLRKLVRLSSNDPVTLLLTSRYLDLIGKRGKILELLNTAYLLNNAQGKEKDIKVTKSILVSLINVTIHTGNLDTAKKYLKEFQEIKGLTSEDWKLINLLKSNLATQEENLKRIGK